jgi:hypothetical protein
MKVISSQIRNSFSLHNIPPLDKKEEEGDYRARIIGITLP